MIKKKLYTYRIAYVGDTCFKKQKGTKKIIKFFCILVFFIFIFLFYLGCKELIKVTLKSEKIIIKNIEVIGTKNITKAEIKELLPFKIGDNILKINLTEAKSKIKKLKPELKNIIITRRWQKVKIKLFERTPEAFIYKNGTTFGIDFDNTPFPLRGFMSAMKVPKIIYKSDSERTQLLYLVKKIKSVCRNFLNNISEIKFSNTGDIILIMNTNTTIFFDNEKSERLTYKFKKIQRIYVDAITRYKQIEYIDITYSFGKAIVKPVLEKFINKGS
ncbi:MAG: FtsQ-type POTRA domain-containing protein [Endomicrobium sp.]|jgi:cell division protein FtsQ|nr:FtsQ-type POTRA domain-containing protein [Endomicrobium sp.]